MKLDEFRQKYPGYEKFSDFELMQGLHRKYYQDIPLDDFAARIGVKLESRPLAIPPEGTVGPVPPQPKAGWGETFRAIPTQAGQGLMQGIGGQMQQGAQAPEQLVSGGNRGLAGNLAQVVRMAPAMPQILGSMFSGDIRENAQRRAEAGRKISADAARRIAEVTPANQTFPQKAVSTALTSTGQMIPGAAVSMATRSPHPLVASFGLLESGRGYDEAIRAGLTPAQAKRHADIVGGLEAGTEYLPAKALFKVGSGPFKRLANFMVRELPGENIAEVGQMLADWTHGLRDDVTVQDVIDTMALTSASTMISGGAQVGAANYLHSVDQKLNARRMAKAIDGTEMPSAELAAREAMAPPQPPNKGPAATPMGTTAEMAPPPGSYAQPQAQAALGLGGHQAAVQFEQEAAAAKAFDEQQRLAVETKQEMDAARQFEAEQQAAPEKKAESVQPTPTETAKTEPPGIKQLPGDSPVINNAEDVKTAEPVVTEVPPKTKARIASMRKLAEGLNKQIEAKLNPAIAEQNLTPRRARIMDSMRKDGERLQEVQSIMTGIADNAEAGTLPAVLDVVKNKKQVEFLRDRLDHNYGNLNADGKAYLKKMGIKNGTEFKAARQAISDYLVPPSEEQVKEQALRKSERELLGRKIPGFFPTPQALSKRMVDMADIQPGMTVLEPSAGTGNIADAIRATGTEPTVVEVSPSLREHLGIKGYKPTDTDFLQHQGRYDRIVMNPPFEKGADIDHVRHAYGLLNPGGKVVAIMGEGTFSNSHKKQSEFRAWLDERGAQVEKLPEGTFNEAGLLRNTGVNARLVTIGKPAESAAGTADTTLHANPIQAVYKGYTDAATKGLNWVNDAIGYKMTPLKKLPQQKEFLTIRDLTQGRIWQAENVTEKVSKAFANTEEAPQVYDYLTTRDADPAIIKDPVTRHKAVATKRLINRIGLALVERGDLSKETYEQHKGTYLPRLYLKHILGEGLARDLGAGKLPSDRGYLKQRLDDESLPQYVRDVILGEIKDPGFLAATGIGTSLRDIAILDYLEQVSENDAWIFPESVTEFDGKKVSVYWLKNEADRLRDQARHAPADTSAEMKARADLMDDTAAPLLEEIGKVPENYVRLPDTPRYGRLRGMYVHEAIHDDLVGTLSVDQQGMNPVRSLVEYGGTGTKITQLFKLSKVALNPPTQVRNFVSNGILVHLSGVPFNKVPIRYAQALDEMYNNGPHWRIAKRHGIKASTFSNNELLRLRRDLVRFKAGSGSPMGWLQKTAASVSEGAGDLYQFSESWGKLAKIIDAMEREGMTEAQAVQEANKWLFDYSMIPQAVRWARNAPIGVPFITFYYKAFPRMLEVMAKAPHRFLPYVAIPATLAAMVAASYDVDKDDLDKLKQALPNWLRERGHAYILPYKDEHGRWQVFDFGYFLPWTMYEEAVTEVAKGDIKAAINTTGVLGGPITDLITAWTTGIDSFTQREISNEADPPSKQLADWLLYGYQLFMPTWLTDKGFFGHMYRALSGHVDPRTGEPKSTVAQAALRLVGANVYPIDPDASRINNIRRMDYELKDIRRRLGQRLRDRNLTEKQRENLINDYGKLMRQKQDEITDYMEQSKIHPNLRRKTKTLE